MSKNHKTCLKIQTYTGHILPTVNWSYQLSSSQMMPSLYIHIMWNHILINHILRKSALFDYRLLFYKRVSENDCGIWSSRLRLFANKALLIPKKAETTVMASLVLQNPLWTKSKASYTTVGLTDQVVIDGSTAEGIWRESGISPNILGKGRLNLKAEQTRETSCNHFNDPGQVPRQWSIFYN